MQVTRGHDDVTIRISNSELELLQLALKRATFEDTPADLQTDILDFTLALLGQLDASAAE